MISRPLPALGAILLLASFAPMLLGQPATKKPFQAQATSSIGYGVKDGEETVEIRNVAYDVSGPQVPGRPPEERLLIRKTTRSKEVLGEKGVEAMVTVEAWPLGASLSQKPLYTIALSGLDSRNLDNALLVVSRGTEEVDWWSIHKLGNGRHLFDTYTPLLRFSISREFLTPRYVGFEAPPDDTPDARLKDPHVVGVVTYASAERVIREALVTCDDPKQAQVLRSYSDATREASLVEGPAAPGQKSREPAPRIRISFSLSYPAPPGTVTAVIPVAGDDLDVAHAQLAPLLHLRAWKR